MKGKKCANGGMAGGKKMPPGKKMAGGMKPWPMDKKKKK